MFAEVEIKVVFISDKNLLNQLSGILTPSEFKFPITCCFAMADLFFRLNIKVYFPGSLLRGVSSSTMQFSLIQSFEGTTTENGEESLCFISLILETLSALVASQPIP